MKKQLVQTINLKGFSKLVRNEFKSRKASANQAFLNDLNDLLSQPLISQQDFLDLFRKYGENIFLKGDIEINRVKFKLDNTPDLRTLPKQVRELFRECMRMAEEKKSKEITDIISNKNFLTYGDLELLRQRDKENLFVSKWTKNTTNATTTPTFQNDAAVGENLPHLHLTQKEDDDDFFNLF